MDKSEQDKQGDGDDHERQLEQGAKPDKEFAKVERPSAGGSRGSAARAKHKSEDGANKSGGPDDQGEAGEKQKELVH